MRKVSPRSNARNPLHAARTVREQERFSDYEHKPIEAVSRQVQNRAPWDGRGQRPPEVVPVSLPRVRWAERPLNQ